MNLEELKELCLTLKAKGYDGHLTIGIQVPLSLEPPHTDQPPKATMRTVMWALNRLKAAPGQPHRQLVRKFLFVRGWIGPDQEPEQWALNWVPITQPDLAKIHSDIQQFEIAQHGTKQGTSA